MKIMAILLTLTIMGKMELNETEIDITIDGSNFKDALLASLHSQVEFLKQIIKEKDQQIEESNLHIRTLLTRESDIYNLWGYKLCAINRQI